MHADAVSVKALFEGGRRYLVPLFQRPYVWNRDDQWEPLWEDILRLADAHLGGRQVRPHFMGAIVLEQIPQPVGQLELRLVVDGQQRLTTLQLLLEAFRDIAAKHRLDRWTQSIEPLTRNEPFYVKQRHERYKLWPTNHDRSIWAKVLDADDPEAVLAAFGSPRYWTGHHIADAYLFFARTIDRWLREGDAEQRAAALFGVVRDLLRVVAINLNQDEDSQLIFETLNARGTPLLASDLIKNFLFHRATQDVETLYAESWSDFDLPDGYWQAFVGRGHARRHRIDLFFQYYLTRRTGEEVPVTHLYTGFRDFLQAHSITAEEELQQIRRNAAIYRMLEEERLTGRALLFMQRLRNMNVVSAYPFLLELFDRFGEDRSTIDPILTDVESFLVRRLVARLSTRSYGRLFIDLMLVLRRDGTDPRSAVREFLLASNTEERRWPSDTEFWTAWVREPVYSRLNKSRVRMLLEGIERQMRSAKSESFTLDEVLSIEHLLPQSWEAHYPLADHPDRFIAESEREAIIHTLGNLTLLTQPLNSSISHGPWQLKRDEILTHSALALNRPLKDVSVWNEEAIRQRAEQTFRAAISAWPHPVSHEWATVDIPLNASAPGGRETSGRVAGRFAKLAVHLNGQISDRIRLSFTDIEAITGAPLPPSAYKHRAWWANGEKAHASAWLSAGWESEMVDFEAKSVAFRRVR